MANSYSGKSLSEKARNNRVVVIAHCIEGFVLPIAYFLEFFKGARTLPYVLIFAVIALLPAVVQLIVYNKNKESDAVKYVLAIGYGLTYAFALFTTNNTLVFTYAIPILVAAMVYVSLKFSVILSVGCFAINVIQVVMFLIMGQYVWEDDSAVIEIQLIVVVLISFMAILVAKVMESNRKAQVGYVSSQGEKTEQLLNHTLSVSSQMLSNISVMSDKISVLKEAVMSTKEAMAEVNTGSTDTADAVQRQLDQTEQIQLRVEAVENGSKAISDGMQATLDAVSVGNENVAKLVTKVNESVGAGREVTREMEELGSTVERMNSIVDIINEITSQTSLLALNASIEAARAGEAGRGFGVVATEISKMADETQAATVRITNLIEEVSEAIKRVVNVSTEMIGMIEEQDEATKHTADSFAAIENNANNIFANSSELVTAVRMLAEANREIVDSVSTISAISEEVAAHANDTYAISEQNTDTVREVASLSDELHRLASSLNS